MSNKDVRLPPIISQYLEKINSDSIPHWEKETAFLMLSHIHQIVGDNLKRYENKGLVGRVAKKSK